MQATIRSWIGHANDCALNSRKPLGVRTRSALADPHQPVDRTEYWVGGLGRAAIVGGCVLRPAGREPAAALADLKTARGPDCPETSAQKRFVEHFVVGAPAARSRVLGAVIGAAVADALGHPTEFLSTTQLHAKYGPTGVTGFELWWERDGRRFAPYTDDTQMAEIVLQALVNKGGPHASLEAAMLEIATRFARWTDHPQGGHRAPGNACFEGARRLAKGVAWREAGGATAGGCGSVMRAYPYWASAFWRRGTGGALVGRAVADDAPGPHRPRSLRSDGRRDGGRDVRRFACGGPRVDGGGGRETQCGHGPNVPESR